MELLGLALLMFLGRVTVDVIATIKGTTPPHIQKAKLRAEQRLREAQQGGSGRDRSQYASGKPTLKDVAAVYWGDAMADVIDSHDRRRAEKKQAREAAKAGAPAPQRPSLRERAKRFGQLLWNGPQPSAGEGTDVVVAVEEALDPRAEGMQPTCDECGVVTDAAWTHPAGSTCSKAADPTGRSSESSWSCKACSIWAGGYSTRAEAKADAQKHKNERHIVEGGLPADPPPAHNTPAPAKATAPWSPFNQNHRYPSSSDKGDDKPAESPSFQGDDWRWSCNACGARSPVSFTDPDESNEHFYRTHRCPAYGGELTPRAPGEKFGSAACPRCGHAEPQIHPTYKACRNAFRQHDCRLPAGTAAATDEGDDMHDAATPTTGTATGDAHDLETAIHQCDLLGDDLTRIDTSLDVIDEAIGSAGTATELVEAFLRSKNVDDTTVGGMASAREMLSPDRIKALIDAIGAAKAGVQNTKELLEAMNDGATAALQGADGSIVNGR